MAYLREIPQRLCYDCRVKATVVLVTWRNEETTAFCRKHGLQREKEMNASEKREHSSRMENGGGVSPRQA